MWREEGGTYERKAVRACFVLWDADGKVETKELLNSWSLTPIGQKQITGLTGPTGSEREKVKEKSWRLLVTNCKKVLGQVRFQLKVQF